MATESKHICRWARRTERRRQATERDPIEARGAAHAVAELAREEIGGDEESRVTGAVLTPSGCVKALAPDPEWEALSC